MDDLPDIDYLVSFQSSLLPTKILVLLSASVERFGVSCMRDYLELVLLSAHFKRLHGLPYVGFYGPYAVLKFDIFFFFIFFMVFHEFSFSSWCSLL